MPLDKLQKQILDDARQKAAGVKAEAEKSAAATLAEADAKVKDAEEKLEEELKAEAARQQEEEQANSELQERAMLLEARHRVVESVLPKVRSIVIKRVRAKGYASLLKKAIEEASRILPQQELILTISKKDAALVKNFRGKVEYGDVGNGIELRNRSGDIGVLVTVEKLFELKKPEIEIMLIEELFPQREAHRPEEGKEKAKRVAAKPKKKAARGKKRK